MLKLLSDCFGFCKPHPTSCQYLLINYPVLDLAWNLINQEEIGMVLQKLIKMKFISQLCKSVEQKRYKEPENMDLKTVTIFGLNLLTILNINKHLKLLFIAPLISKLIHSMLIIVTLILFPRIIQLRPFH